MTSKLAVSRLDYDALRAANNNSLNNCGADEEKLSTLRARILELEDELQAPRSSSIVLLTRYVTEIAIMHCCNLWQLRSRGSKLAMPTLYVVLSVVRLFVAIALVLC